QYFLLQVLSDSLFCYALIIFTKYLKKTHPCLHKDGKNCYEKENPPFYKCNAKLYIFFTYENISLTFSKKLLSPFCGCGTKFWSSFIFSKNSFCSFVSFFGVHTLI